MATIFSQVFERDRHRCVYCGKYMLLDFETFNTSQLDHLVPGSGDDPSNLVLSCYVCNNLKGKHVPLGIDSSTDRAAYIQQVREFFMRARAIKMQELASWTHPA